MSNKRRQYSADDKFKVALEAAKGTQTLAEIASHTGIHPNQFSNGKVISSIRVPTCSGATATRLSTRSRSAKLRCTSRSGA